MQRSRKWQRRFFILYERGSLSFALDELPSTLPQGTVNLNLCTDIGDAEPRTGQRNALCIATSQQEIFIRGDNKEIINGWSEQLAAYLRTNKQVQKKKRKVEPVATAQEPSPAKMAATDPAESGRGRWQEEEQRGGGPDVTEQSPAGNSPAPDGADGFGKPPLDAAPSRDIHQPANDENENQDGSRRSAAERILGSEQGPVSIRGRTEARSSRRESLVSLAAASRLCRVEACVSCSVRASGFVVCRQPDLLNFKKGWMMKLDESDQWKKYWFVLSTDRLRFYKDSMTEEASDLEGELDLTRCYNVSEFLVQRNYGFQIHTPKSVYTLSAMTAGIRKNWIQSLMKNVHPAHAPDVTSLSRGPLELLPRPDVTQDSRSTHVPAERDPHPKPRSVTEKRREGRYRTFDWAEFRPQSGPPPPPPPEAAGPRAGPPCPLELGDLDRRRRREERRRRYEDTLGFSLSWRETGAETEDGSGGALSPRSQRRVEEEIEEMWRQVETTVFRPDGTVPLFTADKDTEEVEKLLDGYRDGAEDLKLRLAESERRRRELEAQLSAAGRLHHHHHRQVTSPEPAPGSEAHLRPSDTNHEPSDGRALSLTEVHEETREPSQQRDVIQDEPPSSTAQPAPSIWLHDTEGNLQEVGHFLSDGVATPLLSADGRRVPSQSDGDIGGLNYDGSLQRQLDGEDGRLFPSSQTQTDEYSAAPLIVEKPDDQAMVRRLSQEVELLTGQNEALNQRNQEMLNQLTEADREIERLKAELSSRYTDAHHLPEVEQQGSVGPEEEDLEKELSARTQELAEAQALIASLKENLRETEELRRDVPAEKEATGEEKSDQRAEAYLLRCFEATEAKLTQLERQLDQSESNRRELQAQNAELREAEERYRQRAAEAEADILRLSGESEEEEEEAFHEDKRRVSGEERIGQVIEGMVVRLEALGAFLEAIDRLDFGKRSECEEETTPDVVRQLKWEEEFWRFLLGELRAGASQSDEEKSVAVLLRDVTEHMIVEREMLLLGLALLSETDEGEGSEGLTAPDAIWNSASVTATGTLRADAGERFERVIATTQMKTSLLNRVASSVGNSASEKLRLMANRLNDCPASEHPWFGVIHSAATEALYCCRLSRLRSECEKELEETKEKLLDCVQLSEENKELKARLSNLEERRASARGEKRSAGCQTEAVLPRDTEEGESPEVETVEDPLPRVEEVSQENVEEGDESHQEVSALRRRVKEAEQLLSVAVEEMTEEHDGKMSRVQMQHEMEMEKLKATCQRGFVSVDESHLKVVEELQRRHRQEVERLLVERDQLLEEESAATATAIEAITNAHRLELQREEQRRRCQSEEYSNGNTVLDDVHREEMESFQRELEVLSQQFCLKCLENGHLLQALDAERKALGQCQQENQELRTRNQELSVHLAAEITRLCSLAKQSELPLGRQMDVYEMEITLRVKESEVQCLKQEITSLKDELQAAQRDKRNATKMYKDVYTELSIVRAKTSRDVDELRENLRLAHRALDQMSP
ncbi:hypothetical protein F2P81_015529 [Scophthalmus maximus]|uniref:PH domain-containing protein n=1 Tax=Scophthalmus maximus TaxID=52904 RepID=A0A6A4SKX0_SCOMX|nr:hypothetical protein F2P81_015529 [Scophthalmus maximus]